MSPKSKKYLITGKPVNGRYVTMRQVERICRQAETLNFVHGRYAVGFIIGALRKASRKADSSWIL